jgi:hypothetical protein
VIQTLRRLLATVALLIGGMTTALAAHPLGASVADFTPHGTQPGLASPFYASQSCQFCHRGTHAADAQTMPFNTWSGSMMANATRDPLFWAALDVANHDGTTHGAPGVGDYCLRCHAPKAWYGGRVVKDGSGGTVDGSNGCKLTGSYDALDDNDNDFSGESCHFCHRTVDRGPGGEAPYTHNANAWIDDGDCNGQGEPCRHGPYNYTVGGNEPPHAWAYSTYLQQSQQCGLCHNVTTPDTSTGPLRTLRDATGVDTGVPFPVERTYSEWLQSDFGDLIFRDALGDAQVGVPLLSRGRSCQDCHMPNSSDPLARACVYDSAGGSRTGNLAVHSLVGGNTWIPTVLSGEFGAALNRVAEFAQTTQWARAMLQGSAQVSVAPVAFVAPAGATPGSATVSVQVTNLSGHKLPTGYAEGRRAWIDLQVRAAGGALVFESGAYDAATGTLTADAQIKIYEVRQGIWDAGSNSCATSAGGREQFHFVLADCIAKDNRIPPLGFVGGGDIETRPVGYTYPVTPGNATHLVNYDRTSYTVTVPPGTALPLSATATLYYQTASRDYIEFLRDEAVAAAIPSEQTMCASSRAQPLTVGPQTRSRGQYAYDLWTTPAYGRSPPETVGAATASLGP